MFSIWEKTSFLAKPDLVVIGAGITGLFAAIHAKRARPAMRVVVLERGPHPSGASVKNAGFACFGSPSEILADMDAEGKTAALERVEERWRGLLELRAELGDDGIGFEGTGGHELFLEDDPLYTRTADRLDELNRDLFPIFRRPAYEWNNAAKGDHGLRTEHLVSTPLEGAVNSGSMMRALVNKAAQEGIDVRFGMEVLAVSEDVDGVRLTIAHGGTINASRVIIATNGYTRGLLPDADVIPARGQVLLTSPIVGLRLKGTFHVHEGYFYFRDYEGRVLLGGGRHLDKAGETTTADGTTPIIQRTLEALLKDVIVPGKAFTIEHRWSGIMGFREHGKSPLVERRSPGIVVAAGLSGMGVAIGIRVARRAALLALE